MELIRFASVAVLAVLTAVVIFLYLRSSFALLERVQQDESLWNSLGRPQKVWVRSSEGGFHTIQPLLPWLSWVWAGHVRDASAAVRRPLRTTSRLLKIGLLLFVLAIGSLCALISTAS